MWKEFKQFISKGSVIDLAVAVIIGAAFSAIVNSLITDIITPLILQPVMQTLDINELEKVAWKGVKYGKFIAAVINFMVTGFIIFLMVKTINKLNFNKAEEAKKEVKETITKEEKLLTEIRDILKEKK